MRKNIITKLVDASNKGFTLVEVIVVIVIITILSGITFVAYSDWEIKSVEAQLKSDLSTAASAMDNARTFNNNYPVAIPTTVKASSEVTLSGGGSTDGKSFCIDATSSRDDTIHYFIDVYLKSKGAKSGTCATRTLCPSGFVVVPGSSTYKTSDFCVMKYEAKNAGGNVPVSRASGTPWVNVSQSQALSYAPNVVGCTGCHLISEAEWMTISQNVLNIGTNWSSGTVGTGYVFSGHNDNSPVGRQQVTNVNDGYNNTNNSSGDTSITTVIDILGGTDYMVGDSQRRTFNLSNGEVIWDLAGNVFETTSGTITGGQPCMDTGGYVFSEYINLNVNTDKLEVPIMPISTGIVGADNWTGDDGIGDVYCSSAETATHAIGRGGDYQWGSGTGIFALGLDYDDSQTDSRSGFRVTAPIQE